MTKRRGHSLPGASSGVESDWATQKLGVLAGYLTNYAKALRQRSLKKAYIDAFANTEYRSLRRGGNTSGSLLFPDLAGRGAQSMLQGWARVALKVQPRFDRYLFIARHAQSNFRLRGLRVEFADRAADILISEGEANDALRSLCGQEWHNRRAVLFLDPFGMQVDWSTVEAIGKTRSIDLWLLLPIGFGVRRAERSADVLPDLWKARLAQLLGGSSWCGDLQALQQPSIWSQQGETLVRTIHDTVGRRLSERLTQVFAGVAGPAILRNDSHRPLYLVSFAAGDPRSKSRSLRQARPFLDALEQLPATSDEPGS